MAKLCVGIDLGGTFIKFGLLDDRRRPQGIFQLPTPAGGGARAVIERMVEGVEEAVRGAGVRRGDIVGVGVGSPGPLSMSKGIVYAAPNIPGFVNLRLRDRVAGKLRLPVALENDANAAAYGEYLCGAGEKCRNMVLLTLGTGVGGGVIVEGQVVRGTHEIGAELGHMILVPGGRPCGCGQRGCIEQYCSATFMSRWAARALLAGRTRSSLRAVIKAKARLDPPQELDAKDVNEARKAGDAFAAGVWDQMARHLAMGCVNFARILDPDRIVLAGGMTRAGRDLLGPVRRHYRDYHWKLTPARTKIALAALGNDAGVIGAAGVAWAEFGS